MKRARKLLVRRVHVTDVVQVENACNQRPTGDLKVQQMLKSMKLNEKGTSFTCSLVINYKRATCRLIWNVCP